MLNSFRREEGDKPLGSRLNRTILFTNPFLAVKRGSPGRRLWYDDYGFLSDIASLRFIREGGFKPTAFGCSKLRRAALRNAAPGKRRKDAGAGHRAVTFFYSTCLALLNRER
jgi:hypothetical protein